MASHRAANPTLKSSGKKRVTCIRDIIREIEEDDRRSDACADTTSGSGTPQSSQSGQEIVGRCGVVGSGTSAGQRERKLVVRVPSATDPRHANERRESKMPSRLLANGSGSRVDRTDTQSQSNDISSEETSYMRIGVKSKKSASISEGMCKQSGHRGCRDKRSMSEWNVPQGARIGDRSSDIACGRDQRVSTTAPIEQHPSDTNGDTLNPESMDKMEELDLVWQMDGMHFLPKLMTGKGSNDFYNVMNEMKAEMKKRKQRRQGLKAAVRMGMMFKGIGDRKARERLETADLSDSDVTDDEAVDAKEAQHKPRDFRSMSRGWKLLSMMVKEEHLKKKKQEGASGWNFLKNAIKHMTDEEKARQELYDRYLNKPDSWADGLVNYPEFLQQRKASLTDERTVKHRVNIKPRPQTANASVNRTMPRPGQTHTHSIGNTGTSAVNKDDIGSHMKHKQLLRRPKSGHV